MPFDAAGAQAAGYSPEEVSSFLAQQNPQFDYAGAKRAGYGDDEIATHLAGINARPSPSSAFMAGAYSPFKPIVDNSLEALKGAATATGEAESEPVNTATADGAMAIPDAAVRAVGKVGNAIGGAFGAMASPLVGATAAAAEPTVPAQARLIASLTGQDPAITAQQAHAVAMKEGTDLANATMLGMGANAGAAKVRAESGLPPNTPPGNPLQPAIEKLSAMSADGSPRVGLLSSQSSDPMVPPPPTFAPQQFQEAINQSYQQAKASRRPFYDFMRQSADGQTIDASQAVSHAKDIVAEIKADPFHEGRPALGKLENFVQTYEANPQMPLADAVEMKQDINSSFNPKRFDQGAKSPYFQIGSSLDTQIAKAGEANPTFAQAKLLADQNHVNNVAMPFTQNKLLEPFWKPQDYYAAQSVKNKLAESLPDETLRRADNLVNNIKDPRQLDAVTRVLPPEMASAFRQSVLKNQTAGASMYRVGEIGNALGSPFTAPKHIFNAVKGQPYSDAAKALIGAAKEPSPTLNPNYQAQLEALKSSYGQPGTPPEPPPTLALPAPETPMTTDSSGNARPMTPEERDAAILGRQNAEQMGLTPDVIAAQHHKAIGDALATRGQSEMGQWVAQQGNIPFTEENAMRAAAGLQQPEYSTHQVAVMLARGDFAKMEAAAQAAKQAQMAQMFQSNVEPVNGLIADSLQKHQDAGLPVGQVGQALISALLKK